MRFRRAPVQIPPCEVLEGSGADISAISIISA